MYFQSDNLCFITTAFHRPDNHQAVITSQSQILLTGVQALVAISTQR